MNEIQKIYCPSCGALVQFLPGREYTFCSSCGSQLFMKDDHLELKLKHEEIKMEYKDRHDERVYQLKKQRTEAEEKRNNTRQKYILLLIEMGISMGIAMGIFVAAYNVFF